MIIKSLSKVRNRFLKRNRLEHIENWFNFVYVENIHTYTHIYTKVDICIREAGMEIQIGMKSPQIRFEQELPDRVGGEAQDRRGLQEGRNSSQCQMLKRIHNRTLRNSKRREWKKGYLDSESPLPDTWL